jgi:sulfofructose kinase
MGAIDVLTVGVAAYDLYFAVDRHPRPDEKRVAESFLSCGGGPAANAAVTVAKMGLKAAFSGYLGRDAFGDLNIQELEAAGVRTEWVVRGHDPTPISSVWVKPDGRRALVSYRPPGAGLDRERVDLQGIAPKVILFDGHEPALSASLLERAREGGITTILDAGSVHPGTSRLYNKVDYLICSQEFSASMTGKEDHLEALAELSRHNENVVITLGEEGLVWKRPNREGALAAFSVDAVDTTGAGDVFHGAFAGCVAARRSWDETLKYASAAAALSCTAPGGRVSIPCIEEVDSFLESHRKPRG